jgi:hypothetical protein
MFHYQNYLRTVHFQTAPCGIHHSVRQEIMLLPRNTMLCFMSVHVDLCFIIKIICELFIFKLHPVAFIIVFVKKSCLFLGIPYHSDTHDSFSGTYIH